MCEGWYGWAEFALWMISVQGRVREASYQEKWLNLAERGRRFKNKWWRWHNVGGYVASAHAIGYMIVFYLATILF